MADDQPEEITKLDWVVPAPDDPFEVVDKGDTTMSPDGTNKKTSLSRVVHNDLGTYQGSADGYHVSSGTYSALSAPEAQLTALQTDGSPTFVAGTFTGTTTFSDSTLAADFTGGEIGNSGGGLTISTGSDGDITLAPDGTGITKTSGFGTSHSLNSPGDLGVAGDLEVHGVTRLDASLYISGATYCYGPLTHPDGRKHRYGSDLDAVWSWNDSVGLVDCVTGGSGPLALPAPKEANEPTLQTSNTVTMSVDESANELNVTVKKSDGTTVSGTIALS